MAFKNKSDMIKYNNQFNNKTYDRINLIVPKGKKAIIKEYAEEIGESVNSLINRLIDAELENYKKGD